MEISLNKHKGEPIYPKIVYHKSAPTCRELINKEGLKVMKGDSYCLHSPEESCPPAIFGYVTGEYDSTYDDDIWEIDTSKNSSINWFEDKETSCEDNKTVVTYQNIPREIIKLIYKGTGE